MNTAIRKLPIGIQNFEDLRSRGFLYVDKTALVYQLVTMGKPYFLSRPRRFGKSLLISTLEAYFEGKKELFKGLAIEKLEQDWIAYPVLHMDLNAEKYDSVQSLDAIIDRYLFTWEDLWGKDERETTLSSRFFGLLRRIWEKTGKQAVVLIDEYDKPLLQTIHDPVLQEEYRSTLKSFYGVLKSADRYLRFVFLTGVTKFAQVSVFSDLNQLNDISMNPDYATLCGITHEELTANFLPELELLAKANGFSDEETLQLMTRKYDGYHFRDNTPGVFNPFSVLNALQSRRFDNFWFQTGTPTFLVELLKKSEFDLRVLIDGVEAGPSSFTEYRANVNNPIPIIYQSGYLTIKDYDREFNLYILKFPNEEVEYGFMNFLLPYYTSVQDEDKGFYIGKFVR